MSSSEIASDEPSFIPSSAPSEDNPELSFTEFPSTSPSLNPSDARSAIPTSNPSTTHSIAPTSNPSTTHSLVPTSNPSETHSRSPTGTPSGVPSTSINPTTTPSGTPTAIPSVSNEPSSMTSTRPTFGPASWCENIDRPFRIRLPDGSYSTDNGCAWVAVGKERRCDLEGVRDNCPVTCDYCMCKDNPGTFSTRFSNSRDCQWVSENLSICSMQPSAEYNCPLTCGKCAEVPSAAPSNRPTTESPSKAITTTPSLSWCQDSTDQFSVEANTKDCSWVGKKKQVRCDLEGVRDNCPVICDYCLCKDNPRVFSTRVSIQRDCQWVSENLSVCYRLPLVEDNCPLTCGKCPARPSAAPSDKPSTESPSRAPILSPSVSWCQDSTDQLSVNGNTRDCSWVAAKKQIRCNFGGISDNCPVTCDSCKCMDNPGTFLGKDFLDKTCQWVSEELSRCNVQPLAEYNCPLTCGKCSEPPSIVPSKAKNTEMPSAAPTISPSFSPVEIYENIQLQIGPLVGDMSMNDDNKKFLKKL
jgi:hypothetical protein